MLLLLQDPKKGLLLLLLLGVRKSTGLVHKHGHRFFLIVIGGGFEQSLPKTVRSFLSTK